ncbi:hypothetical protein A9Q88_02465 [Gammaproteobacteria bacterium 50_400_T64]|nr:hypothetical protein A9Q88_02465 [Gammaproteobacteria bacterium 50_400_T64]
MAEEKETSTTKLPSEMLRAHLLALLKNWSGYGYELANKLEAAGYGGYNSGTLYRTLRQMEKTGLISSMWDTSSDGPARRVYSLTKTGSLFLNNWFTLLDMHKATLNNFMKMAENVVDPCDKSSTGKRKDVDS